jgi:hypothetical protein
MRVDAATAVRRREPTARPRLDASHSHYPWNYLDLINQGQGLTGPNDPTGTYREHANRLKRLGL